MAPLESSAIALLLYAQGVVAAPPGDLPRYPLGSLDVPPMSEPARPVRLVDLRYRLQSEGSSSSAIEARTRLGGFAFVGAEVDEGRDRRALFVDLHRLELGVARIDEAQVVEANLRASMLRLRTRGEKRSPGDGGRWVVGAEGALRLGPDWEIVVSHEQDLDDRSAEPPSVAAFIETGAVPPIGLPTRPLRESSLGFLYQRDSHLEVAGETSLARLRTEGGFDATRSRASGSTSWTRAPLRLAANAAVSRTTGRLSRTEGLVDVSADVKLGGHLLVSAGTRQEWELGVLRFEEVNRVAVQLFGRRYRFPREGEAAALTLGLARRAVALGLNERRVYGEDERRAFRERLGISSARDELAPDLEALYRAQVRERNVPLAGVEMTWGSRKLLGVESRRYGVFFALPWRPGIGSPLTRSEAIAEFLRVELSYGEDRFASGLRARSHEVSITVALNREIGLELAWRKMERTADEIARRDARPSVLTFGFVYELGR